MLKRVGMDTDHGTDKWRSEDEDDIKRQRGIDPKRSNQKSFTVKGSAWCAP